MGDLAQDEERERYLVFCGSKYYPCGGWNDFKGSYFDLEQAEAWLSHVKSEMACDGSGWAHIVDLETQKVIKSERW